MFDSGTNCRMIAWLGKPMQIHNVMIVLQEKSGDLQSLSDSSSREHEFLKTFS